MTTKNLYFIQGPTVLNTMIVILEEVILGLRDSETTIYI